MRFGATALLLSALMLFAPLAPAQTTVSRYAASVGGTEIALPIPPGFDEAGARAPGVRQLGSNFTPASNRLLAMFVSEADLRAAESSRPPALRRYFLVQTLRSAEAQTITADSFAPVKRVLRTQFDAVLASARPQINAEAASASSKTGEQIGRPDLSVKIGEIVPLGIFDERPSSISVALMTKVAIKTGSIDQEVPLAMALTTLVLNSRVVYFYAYSYYESDADLDWIRSATGDWLAAALP